MTPYILISHVSADRIAADRFCHILAQYGFRYSIVDETTASSDRAERIAGAAYLVVLTSPAAAKTESVVSAVREARARRIGLLAISLSAGPFDDLLSRDGEVVIPAPEEGSGYADRALFVHRAFVRHLARVASCHAAQRCVDDRQGDGYGHAVSLAVRAHAGDGEAAYDLACLYERGHGVPALEGECAAWMGRAASHGVPDALISMGLFRLQGQGVETDAEEACRLFAEAAGKGDPRGAYHRALCYLYGHGVLKDPDRAFYNMKIAARAGYAPALFRLGLMYRDGVGTERRFAAALKCFYEACRRSPAPQTEGAPVGIPTLYGRRAGHGTALRGVTMRHMGRTRIAAILGKRIPTGTPVGRFTTCRIRIERLPEDACVERLLSVIAGAGGRPADLSAYLRTTHASTVYGEGDSYAERAAYDPAEAATALGHLLADGCSAPDADGETHLPRPTRAIVWYRYALCYGGTGAFYRLAEAYRQGKGAPTSPERAVRLYRIAAAGGDVRGQFALAVCYERGIGVAPDPVEAVRCYEAAANAGHASAANNLGGCYESGRGVPRNLLAAVEWYTRAAAQGQLDATCRLGLCYERGIGVTADRGRAANLYRAAARGGHGYAMYRLGLLLEHGYADEGEMDKETRPSTMTATETEVRMDAGEVGIASTAPHYGRVIRLFRAAADAGVVEAAYALAVCYAEGHGVPNSVEQSYLYLSRAAAGGSIQACYALGMCLMDGRGVVVDPRRARAAFSRAIERWERDGEHDPLRVEDLLPVGGMTQEMAVAGALYMLGYCTLYALGETDEPFAVMTEPPVGSERIHAAVGAFRRAADMGHVGALTALGDLHMYGALTSTGDSAETSEAMECYAKAARLGREAAKAAGADRSGSESVNRPVNALLSLSSEAIRQAEVHAAENDRAAVELAYGRSWRYLAAAAGLGSADALVAMADGAYYGNGTKQNRSAAIWFLEHAEAQSGGRAAASLWLGDCLCVSGEGYPAAADEAYSRALTTPVTVSECGAHVVEARRRARLRDEGRVRAEAHYRLAVLRAMHGADEAARRTAFGHLVKAIRLGHAAARDDLARMYAHESALAAERMAAESRREARRRRKTAALPPLRPHEVWLTDYYTARRQVSVPFCFEMRIEAADPAAYAVSPVTDVMRAAALNYLGDCFFDGRDLPAGAEDAVACYRAAVALPIRTRRGEPLPRALTWANYSLGWCLLNGVGVAPDARAAVRHLTAAARDHAEAAFLLAVCHEHGTGVDAPDDGEAIRYYRRALKNGYRPAEPKVNELEKRLKDAAE